MWTRPPLLGIRQHRAELEARTCLIFWNGETSRRPNTKLLLVSLNAHWYYKLVISDVIIWNQHVFNHIITLWFYDLSCVTIVLFIVKFVASQQLGRFGISYRGCIGMRLWDHARVQGWISSLVQLSNRCIDVLILRVVFNGHRLK